MRRSLPVLAVLLAWAGTVQANGLLIPEEKSLPPLAMLSHKVNITIEDQVAVTRVEQTFRNHTDRNLEATYIFPVPKGASVNKFTMWVNGQETKGELLEADKARAVYTSFVRRTQDPGLLEYLGNNLLQMKVFPIGPRSDQKVTLSYTSVADKESNLVEYIYPLKTDGKATGTLETFSITGTIKSQHAIQNVYSPTHLIALKRSGDNTVEFSFEKNQGLLDKDFQLFYSTGDKDIGLTALTHRPLASENGYFALLITPKVEIPKEYQIPRDVVLVLDTSGSMRGVKMEQAKKALKYCLENLGKHDRFAMMNFATTVNPYRDKLTVVDAEQIGAAKKWVDNLEANGATAIDDALKAALDFRPKDGGRSFNIVFFTDGEPTIGEKDPKKILKNFAARNSANTRVFTFGVGDDVNATFLDSLADQTRGVVTYVRPAEDIEAKVSGLYAKISNPVLTNLKLTSTSDMQFNEMYPAQLPDLFHGQQLIVFGRFNGKGAAAIKLTGQVGMETKEFFYELKFPEKTDDSHEFVEQLWARRKVGYMLDQVRAHGENKELVSEIVALAKKYGITTPYTSWLIVPDGPVPVAGPRPGIRRDPIAPGAPPPALAPVGEAKKPESVEEFAKRQQEKPGDIYANRGRYEDKDFAKGDGQGGIGGGKAKQDARDKKATYDEALEALRKNQYGAVQTGKLGVDLSCQMQTLRNQTQLDQTALKNVYGRNCIEVGGVWIDEKYDPKTMKTLTVKAQSNAYFKMLERNPKVKEVFRLGNHVLWVTPNQTALIIDTSTGKEDLTDAEVDALFAAKK